MGVMSHNFKNIAYLLRSARLPCRVRFGFEKKRYTYKYDYDSKLTPAVKFLQRERLEIPSDSNGAHFGYEGITLNFKSWFDSENKKKLGLKIDSHTKISASEYRKFCESEKI